MTDRPAVRLDALVRRVAGRTLVHDLSLQIHPGEIFTLLGPSGCGKTTTLRMVAGLDRPDGGRIEIGGAEVAGGRWVPPEERRVGMVFQSHAVWPHRTVLENVAYPLRIHGDPDAGRHAREALARVRLDGVADRWPHTLSGGQQQRVALARALVARPRVLLLDEPLSSLDAGLRVELRAQIHALAKEAGLTVLLVTHDQEEALEISDRIAVMREGRIVQTGSPQELYHAPVDAFVAGFLGPVSWLTAVRRADRVWVGDDALVDAAGPDGPVRVGFRPEGGELGGDGIPVQVSGAAFRGSYTRFRVRAAQVDADLLVDGDAPGPRLSLRRAWVHPVDGS